MKVLVSAFTCGPSGGSEPGQGWAWTLAAARENEVWVLTRFIPADRLEQVIAEQAATNLTVVYIDPPPWIRRWFRGGFGLRMSYLVWQRQAAKVARQLHGEIGFDLVHHLTFANVWLPAGASVVNAPFVLGPVGGGPRVTLRMWPELGVRGAVMESIRIAGQMVSRLNPVVRRGWRRAKIILVQNRETLDALPRRYRHKCRIRQNAVIAAISAPAISHAARKAAPAQSRHVAMYAGRLVAWKGPGLAVRAIAALSDWDLVIVGSGPELQRLRRLVRDLRLDERVEFVGWLPQQDLQLVLAGADVVVVPSLRDDGPNIVAEAQALGRPVAGFDEGGRTTFATLEGTVVELASLACGRRQAAASLADAIVRAGATTVAPSAESYSVDRIVDDLRCIYAEATGTANGREPTFVREVSRA
jgi:glycosyltransferase involved in cell wall biosynthesis